MSERDDLLLVKDILEAGEKILRFTSNISFDEFLLNEMMQDAVVRNFEIIGEASSRISADYQGNKSHLPWAEMKGLRNRLIHEYFGVDFNIVWNIIQHQLEPLVESLNGLVQES